MKKICFILGSFTLLVLMSTNINAQNSIIWDYPIKPGSEKWKSFQSHDEMLKVCQIPEDILKKIPTKDLLKICMNYPLSLDLFVYSSVLEGFERTTERFNGFRELLQRADNYGYILSELRNNIDQSYAFLLSTDTLEIGNCIMKISLLETMLSFKGVQKMQA